MIKIKLHNNYEKKNFKYESNKLQLLLSENKLIENIISKSIILKKSTTKWELQFKCLVRSFI